MLHVNMTKNAYNDSHVTNDYHATRAVAKLAKTDLQLLSVFVTVVDSGGFSAAQVSLNVGQSTISRQMSDLEARLGIRLCQRGRSGFGITQKGRAVYEAAQTLFRALDGFRTEVGALRGQLIGDLSIAVIDNWVGDSSAPVSDAIAAMKKDGPEVQIALRCIAPDEIEHAVLTQQVNIGIGVFHQHNPGLLYEHIIDDPTELYCGRNHPLFRHKGSFTTDDLNNLDYVRRAYLSERRVAPSVSRLKSSALAHQLEGIAFLILSGCYVGYLPVAYAHSWVRNGLMRKIDLPELGINTSIEIVTRRGVKQSLVVKTFLNYLRQAKK